MSSIKQFDKLNTSYVNLAALLRYLREQDFSGAIHVALNQYEAEIFLDGSGAAAVYEIDRVSGVPVQDEGAMERALVHAREPGGAITVYEGKTLPGGPTRESALSSFADQVKAAGGAPTEEVDWDGLYRASGDVIAAVERAVVSGGADFAAHFRTACILVGDDYPFLDPTASNFEYASGSVTLDANPGTSAYVAGLSECLRRVVNKLAIDKEGQRFRERVAVELAVAARHGPLGDFQSQLDRIAGTRVL